GGFSGSDRATRLADVILAWNVFQHFYPYHDVVQTDWPAALRAALTTAATDADDLAFIATLRRLVVALKDGHGKAGHPAYPSSAVLPIAWAWVEEELVVTQAGVGVAGVKPGDVVLAIDGKPAANALAEKLSQISGATPQWR